MKRLFVLFIFCVLLSACNSLNEATPEISSSTIDIMNEKVSYHPLTNEELKGIKQTISEHINEIEEQHSMKILILGVGQDHILIKVRRSGEVDRTISKTEIEALKKELFGLAGTEFPMKLSIWACCTKEVDITGKIELFNEETNEILIINEQKNNGNSEYPEATWVNLTGDGILIVSGSNVLSGFDKSIVGREARVWTTGVIAESYPRQTSALKVVVE